MISYAGVELSVASPDVKAWIDATLRPEQVLEASLATWPGSRLQTYPFASYPLAPVRVNSLFWPRSAKRFAIGYYLAHESQLAAIRQTYSSSAPPLTRKNLVLSDGNNSVTVSLYMLQALPLASSPAGPNFYLVPLADERWADWFFTDTIQVTEGITTWGDVASMVGLSVDDSIDAAYLKPAVGLSATYEAKGILADALAFSVGKRCVQSLDGETLHLQGPATAAAIVAANLQMARQLSCGTVAGGSITPDKLDDIPKGARSFFPCVTVDPVTKVATPTGGYYVWPTTGVQTSDDTVWATPIPYPFWGNDWDRVTIHSSATAILEAVGMTLIISNKTDLIKLGNRLDLDMAGWMSPGDWSVPGSWSGIIESRLGSNTGTPNILQRRTFAGVMPWQPEGYHDITWEHNQESILTRIDYLPPVERGDSTLTSSSKTPGDGGGSSSAIYGNVFFSNSVTTNNFFVGGASYVYNATTNIITITYPSAPVGVVIYLNPAVTITGTPTVAPGSQVPQPVVSKFCPGALYTATGGTTVTGAYQVIATKNFTVNAAATVLVRAYVHFKGNTAVVNDEYGVKLIVDTIDQSGIPTAYPVALAGDSTSGEWALTLAAGIHTIDLAVGLIGGTGAADAKTNSGMLIQVLPSAEKRTDKAYPGTVLGTAICATDDDCCAPSAATMSVTIPCCPAAVSGRLYVEFLNPIHGGVASGDAPVVVIYDYLGNVAFHCTHTLRTAFWPAGVLWDDFDLNVFYLCYCDIGPGPNYKVAMAVEGAGGTFTQASTQCSPVLGGGHFDDGLIGANNHNFDFIIRTTP